MGGRFSRAIIASLACALSVATSGCSLNFRYLNQSQQASGLTAAHLLSTANAVADSWKILGGATTIDIETRLEEEGTLYYVVYRNTNPGVMTAEDIRTAALGGPTGALVRAGTVAITQPNQSVLTSLAGLVDNSTYYVLIAAEGQLVGLYPDTVTRSYTQVNPDQMYVESFASGNLKGDGTVTSAASADPYRYPPGATGAGQPITTRYMVYRPEAHYKESVTRYPMIVALQGGSQMSGAGPGGANDDTQAQFSDVTRNQSGLLNLIELGTIAELPAIVIMPRCPQYPVRATTLAWGGVPWTDTDCWNWLGAIDLIDEVIQHAIEVNPNLRVDPDRVYITGLSTGGAGAVVYTRAHPERIAAMAPIATASNITGCISSSGTSYACPTPSSGCATFAGIGIWFFHNDIDATQTSATSQSGFDQALSCGYTDARFTRYNASGHNSWNKTYNGTGGAIMPGDGLPGTLNDNYTPYGTSSGEPDVITWLLQHSK